MAQPNILLITLDTVRSDALGCYGSQTATPTMDHIASTGVVFDQAITNGSYTKSAFPPILSSTYASQYGGPFQDASQRRPMLARVLKEAGYQTGGFTANPLLAEELGYDEGFDGYREPVPPEERRWWLKLKGAQAVLRNQPLNGLLTRLGLNTLPNPVYVSGEVITDLAVSWVKQCTSPFFLWLHYMDAHWPYHAMESLQDGASRAKAWQDLHKVWVSRGKHPGDETVARMRGLYAAGVERLDHQVDRLIRALGGWKALRDTIVVLTADHGEAFWEHGHWQHGAVYAFQEEILRVPLIVKAPDLPESVRSRDLVSLIDLAPTLLDLAGIEAPAKMEGRSLRPVMENGSPGSSLVISEMVDLNWYCVALRSERYKYVYDERRPTFRQLFDLRQDPGEKQDLFGQRPGEEAEFENHLQRHLERVRSEGERDDGGGWQVEGDVVRRLKALGYIE